jgi:hypothetical protein
VGNTVAVVDIDEDGFDEIVTGQLRGAGGRVRTFDALGAGIFNRVSDLAAIDQEGLVPGELARGVFVGAVDVVLGARFLDAGLLVDPANPFDPFPPGPLAPGVGPQVGVPAVGVQGVNITAPGFPRTGFPTTGFPTTGFPATGFPTTGFPTSVGGFPTAGFPTTAGFAAASQAANLFPTAGLGTTGLGTTSFQPASGFGSSSIGTTNPALNPALGTAGTTPFVPPTTFSPTLPNGIRQFPIVSTPILF